MEQIAENLNEVREWLSMETNEPAQLREELVARVILALRLRGPLKDAPLSDVDVATPLYLLQHHFPASPETLFCIGLEALANDQNGRLLYHWSELERLHPTSPYAAMPALALADWKKENLFSPVTEGILGAMSSPQARTAAKSRIRS